MINSTLELKIATPYARALYDFSFTDEGIQFLRETADKLFIFISDEDEQSSITPSVMHEWLKAEYDTVQHDAVAIVVTENSECEYSSINIGDKYIDLVKSSELRKLKQNMKWELRILFQN